MRKLSIVVAFFVLTTGALADEAPNSPVGLWRIIGDSSGEAEALIAISEHDGQYDGKIIRVFPRPGVTEDAICELCRGPQKNMPVRGLTILSGLRHNRDEYTDGVILDPDSGDTYRCTAKLSADNRKLYVRGYIGIPLIGRTQTWLRE